MITALSILASWFPFFFFFNNRHLILQHSTHGQKMDIHWRWSGAWRKDSVWSVGSKLGRRLRLGVDTPVNPSGLAISLVALRHGHSQTSTTTPRSVKTRPLLPSPTAPRLPKASRNFVACLFPEAGGD
jgi:hypothetical protein